MYNNVVDFAFDLHLCELADAVNQCFGITVCVCAAPTFNLVLDHLMYTTGLEVEENNQNKHCGLSKFLLWNV